MDASVDTMGSNDPAPYVDNWFDGKTIRNARKILVRWTEKKEAVANDMKFCGNMYSHYFNYKLRRVLHKTRRGGELDFWAYYNKHGYYPLKKVFRPKFLTVIKNEILNALESKKLQWKPVAISKKQVTSILFDKLRLEDPEEHGGCDFLHHFLSGLVKGSFPKKKFFEMTLLKTVTDDKEWEECCYHQDLTDPPAHFLDNDFSPITLYFSIDDKDLNLDIAPRRQKTGRPPHEFTHTLNSGDILLFDTCRLKHRSSKPKPTDSDTQPYRVNIAMTGLADFLTFDAVSSTSEDELEQEPKKKRSKKG